MTEDPAASRPLGAVLQRMSMHLDSLAAEVEQIEHAICDELDHSADRADGRIQQFQRLDYLRQSVADVAMLCAFLARGHGQEVDPAIAGKLRLQHTKDLMDPDQLSPLTASAVSPTGVELF